MHIFMTAEKCNYWILKQNNLLINENLYPNEAPESHLFQILGLGKAVQVTKPGFIKSRMWENVELA